MKNVCEVEHDTIPVLVLRSNIVAPRHSDFDGQHIFAAYPGWAGAIVSAQTGWGLASSLGGREPPT
jgi:hypothetical protein